jgi:steroid 5-alpha reductase family enzyme
MAGVLMSLLPVAALVAVYMTAWFVVALVKKDNSVADIAWGLGFVLAAGVTLIRRGDGPDRPVLATTLVLIWGLRLAVHIMFRNRKRGEDYRYAEWRRRWGRWFVARSYLQVFLLQGFFLLIISSPVILMNSTAQGSLGLLDLAGTAVWVVGFLFEAVGDAQLARFKRDPGNRGKIMDRGLWQYTRHPNYFGESLMWWGLFILALSVPGGWATVVSPVLITFLLVRVSGVPLLERKYAGNAAFQAYARRTSVFVPWFPKSPKSPD